MSFGLGHGKELDPGRVGVSPDELPPMPDAAVHTPRLAWVDPRRWFPEPTRPFELEIGSGKGTFLLQHAAANPGVNILGIEWAGEFYAYAADRVRRAGLTNVRVLHADATEFIRWRVPDSITAVIHLYFSDPWPKTRHHKRRVVQEPFLRQAHRVLTPGGELRIVTDHDDYWAWMQEHFARVCEPSAPVSGPSRSSGSGASSPPSTEPRASIPVIFRLEPFQPPESAGDGELVGTNFERKYRREGRPFHAAVLRKPDQTA